MYFIPYEDENLLNQYANPIYALMPLMVSVPPEVIQHYEKENLAFLYELPEEKEHITIKYVETLLTQSWQTSFSLEKEHVVFLMNSEHFRKLLTFLCSRDLKLFEKVWPENELYICPYNSKESELRFLPDVRVNILQTPSKEDKSLLFLHERKRNLIAS